VSNLDINLVGYFKLSFMDHSSRGGYFRYKFRGYFKLSFVMLGVGNLMQILEGYFMYFL